MCLKDFKKAQISIDEQRILDFLENTGIPIDSVPSEDVELCEIEGGVKHFELAKKVDATQSYYYYKGAFDDKTRPFCRRLLQMNKYWGETDLLILSERLRYSVFLFQGGFNCRHVWQKARLKKADLESGKVIPDQPRLNQIYSVAKQQESGLGKYFPLA